jgi:histidine triad (HIT) family protein
VTAAPDDCVFCRIVAGEIPARLAYAGPLAVAFHDVHPAAPLHVLIVPRQHIIDATHIGAEHGLVLAEMMGAARDIVNDEGLSPRGYRLTFNVGPDAGLQVSHLHMHLLAGRELGWPPG